MRLSVATVAASTSSGQRGLRVPARPRRPGPWTPTRTGRSARCRSGSRTTRMPSADTGPPTISIRVPAGRGGLSFFETSAVEGSRPDPQVVALDRDRRERPDRQGGFG